jgi:hypothetical protein
MGTKSGQLCSPRYSRNSFTGDEIMISRRSELSSSKINREWPHQRFQGSKVPTLGTVFCTAVARSEIGVT